MPSVQSALTVSTIAALKTLQPDVGNVDIRKVTEVDATYDYPDSFYVWRQGASYTEALPGIVESTVATGFWVMFPTLILSTSDASGAAAFPGITWVNTTTNARFISNPDLTWSAIAAGTGASTTLTTTGFTQPAVGSNVTLNVGDSSIFAVGQYVFVEDGGVYLVASKPGATQLEVTNLGTSENAAPATSISTGRLVTTSGRPGSIVDPWTSVTASTVTLSSFISGRYLIDASSNNIVVTIPTAAAMGETIEHTLKRIDDGGAYTVTVNCSGSDTYDGTAGDTSRQLSIRSQIKLGSDGVDKILLG